MADPKTCPRCGREVSSIRAGDPILRCSGAGSVVCLNVAAARVDQVARIAAWFRRTDWATGEQLAKDVEGAAARGELTAVERKR